MKNGVNVIENTISRGSIFPSAAEIAYKFKLIFVKTRAGLSLYEGASLPDNKTTFFFIIFMHTLALCMVTVTQL